MTYPVIIGDKEYTKNQLLEYGKRTYPKFYWIPRGIGLGFTILGTLALLINLVLMAELQSSIDEYNESIKSYQYITVEPESMPAQMYFYVVIYSIMIFVGIILLVVSAFKKPDQAYIDHAYRRLTQIENNRAMREAYEEKSKEPVKEEEIDPKLEELKKYKKLLDEGLITQEVYDAKQEEYVNGRRNPRDPW